MNFGAMDDDNEGGHANHLRVPGRRGGNTFGIDTNKARAQASKNTALERMRKNQTNRY